MLLAVKNALVALVIAFVVIVYVDLLTPSSPGASPTNTPQATVQVAVTQSAPTALALVAPTATNTPSTQRVMLPVVAMSLPTETTTPIPTNTPLPTVAPSDTPLPTNTAIPTIAPTVTPLSDAAVVKSSHSFWQDGHFYIVGETVNTSTQPVYSTQIQARLLNAANELVATGETYSRLDMTLPNQPNPFRLEVLNASPSITHYELSVAYQSSTFLEYRPITVLSHGIRDNYGVEVFGDVRNDSSDTVSPPYVIVTFYDASNAVVDTFFVLTSRELNPQQTSVYAISTFSNLDGERKLEYSSYAVQAQGYVKE